MSGGNAKYFKINSKSLKCVQSLLTFKIYDRFQQEGTRTEKQLQKDMFIAYVGDGKDNQGEIGAFLKKANDYNKMFIADSVNNVTLSLSLQVALST